MSVEEVHFEFPKGCLKLSYAFALLSEPRFVVFQGYYGFGNSLVGYGNELVDEMYYEFDLYLFLRWLFVYPLVIVQD